MLGPQPAARSKVAAAAAPAAASLASSESRGEEACALQAPPARCFCLASVATPRRRIPEDLAFMPCSAEAIISIALAVVPFVDALGVDLLAHSEGDPCLDGSRLFASWHRDFLRITAKFEEVDRCEEKDGVKEERDWAK